MHLYQINCPVFTNDGHANYEEARKLLESFILDKAGGFTRFPMVEGQRSAMKTGKVYIEPVVPIQFAVEETKVGRVSVGLILHRAQELFKDQETLFLAKLGTAQLITREGPS